VDVTWQVWSDAIAAGVRAVPDKQLLRVAEVLAASRLVITAGNGGSHALASHAAQALMKPGYAPGGGVAAHCLSDAVSTLSAHANDGGWEGALEELARPIINLYPTMLLFSSSGKSENIVRLAKLGISHGCNIIAFTGFGGEPLRSLVTRTIHVDSYDYEVVEPVHDALLHRVQYHIRTIGRE
jgi:D-sedoheptulose 7-phosphate isomerase